MAWENDGVESSNRLEETVTVAVTWNVEFVDPQSIDHGLKTLELKIGFRPWNNCRSCKHNSRRPGFENGRTRESLTSFVRSMTEHMVRCHDVCE